MAKEKKSNAPLIISNSFEFRVSSFEFAMAKDERVQRTSYYRESNSNSKLETI